MPAKILVVDDEIIYLTRLIEQLFEKQIEQNEYEFIYAKDGQEALEKIHDLRPDLLMTDIKMPNLDGLALLHKLNEEKLDLKTIIISAYGTIDYISQGMQERAYDFLLKPLDRKKLETSVRKILLRSQTRQISQEILPPASKQKQTSKINYHSVLRLVRELPLTQQLELVSQVVSKFPLEQLDTLQNDLPHLRALAQEEQTKRELVAQNDLKRLKQNQIPLALLEEGYIEIRNRPYHSVSGETREYTYLYLRWTDPETKKLKGRTIKKKDLQEPRVLGIVEQKIGKTIDPDDF